MMFISDSTFTVSCVTEGEKTGNGLDFYSKRRVDKKYTTFPLFNCITVYAFENLQV